MNYIVNLKNNTTFGRFFRRKNYKGSIAEQQFNSCMSTSVKFLAHSTFQPKTTVVI